jgi:hypothetical protein
VKPLIPELDGESLTSSELLRYIPDAMLMKAFNNVFFKHLLSLARPAGAADRSYLPIAGDSAAAKAAVTEFIESVGYSVVDAGPLADSWRQATGTPVWGPRTGRSRTRRASSSARTPSARHWPPQRGNRKLARAAVWPVTDLSHIPAELHDEIRAEAGKPCCEAPRNIRANSGFVQRVGTCWSQRREVKA